MQLFYWVCYETGAFLSLLVCIANVSSGEGTLLYVCVCVCFHWWSVYFDQRSLELCYNIMVVSQLKICLQFDFIWWGLVPCRRFHRHFECCSREEEEAGTAYCLIKSREILIWCMCDRASYMKMTRSTNLMQQLWFIIISSLYMFRTSICPSSGVFYIQVVYCCMWCSAIGVVAVVLRSRCVVLCTVCEFVSDCVGYKHTQCTRLHTSSLGPHPQHLVLNTTYSSKTTCI